MTANTTPTSTSYSMTSAWVCFPPIIIRSSEPGNGRTTDLY
jgi:hypothetical protein